MKHPPRKSFLQSHLRLGLLRCRWQRHLLRLRPRPQLRREQEQEQGQDLPTLTFTALSMVVSLMLPVSNAAAQTAQVTQTTRTAQAGSASATSAVTTATVATSNSASASAITSDATRTATAANSTNWQQALAAPQTIHLVHGESFSGRITTTNANGAVIRLSGPGGGEMTLPLARIARVDFPADTLWQEALRLQNTDGANAAHTLFSAMYDTWEPALPLLPTTTLERLPLIAQNALQAGDSFFAVRLSRRAKAEALARSNFALALRFDESELLALWQLELFDDARTLAEAILQHSDSTGSNAEDSASAANNTNTLRPPATALPHAVLAAHALLQGDAEAALEAALRPVVLSHALGRPAHLEATQAVALLACERLGLTTTAQHLRASAAGSNEEANEAPLAVQLLATPRRADTAGQ